MIPAPGAMLTPTLRLVSLLGHGGMGSVWRAEHATLGKQVAVKVLAKELADDAEAHARFVREATLLGQLKSPYVVAVHDFGESEGTPFFVMELLEGEDLGDRLERAGRLPLGTVTAIVSQLAKALDRIHEVGIVHRDLKPGNVYLTKVDGDLVVKLVDFGIAKNAQASFKTTSTGALLGTPLYMSPEQVLSTKDVGPPSDLYSLGVLAYECLTGHPPFTGETLGAIHVAITQGRYARVTQLVPGLHPALDAWFACALASDPASRFGSGRELAEAFLGAARGVVPGAAGSGAGSAAGSSPSAAGKTARMGSAPALAGLAPHAHRTTTRTHSRRAVVAIGAGLLAGLGLAAVVISTWGAKPRAASETAATSEPTSASPAPASASASPPSSASASPSTDPSSATAPLSVTSLPAVPPPASASASPMLPTIGTTAGPLPAGSGKKPPRPRKDRGF